MVFIKLTQQKKAVYVLQLNFAYHCGAEIIPCSTITFSGLMYCWYKHGADKVYLERTDRHSTGKS